MVLQSKVGQGYKFSSVGSRFKRQLQDLMDALHKMEPHYIRCIKPNSFNRRAPCMSKCLALLHASGNDHGTQYFHRLGGIAQTCDSFLRGAMAVAVQADGL